MIACALGRWIEEIGDPGWSGWVIVALYLLAAGLSVRAAVWARARDERVFWLIAAGLMAVYAANKELDLQTVLTALGRCASKAEGWHDRRWMLQLAVTVVLGAGFLGVVGLAALRLRHLLSRTGIAAAGLVLTSAYVIGRAVIINHVDRLAGLNLATMRLSWLFEVPGPLLVIAGASVDAIRRAGQKGPHTSP
jgi:hypothetical protein